MAVKDGHLKGAWRGDEVKTAGPTRQQLRKLQRRYDKHYGKFTERNDNE